VLGDDGMDVADEDYPGDEAYPGDGGFADDGSYPDDGSYSAEAAYADEAEYSDEAGYPAAADLPAAGVIAGTGPWDGAGSYPTRDRMDFGSLLVPAQQGMDVQVNMAEDQGVWVAVVRGDSALQLQAFAAPKTSGIWDEVREEIADEVTRSGGDSREADGPLGKELHARVHPGQPGDRRQPLQQVRFLGVDGPRWFLRGVISGPAARRPELARPFEDLFADVVVIRGDHPAVPRELLEIRLPEEARKALEEQLGDTGEGPQYPNPFERGPEITETR
jgi:Protein of unknown function (DUF3710)